MDPLTIVIICAVLCVYFIAGAVYNVRNRTDDYTGTVYHAYKEGYEDGYRRGDSDRSTLAYEIERKVRDE